MIPTHVDVTIIADGEFCSPGFLRRVNDYSFHCIVRTKKNILFNGKKIESHPLSFNSRGIWDFSFGKYTSVEMNARVIANTHSHETYYLVTDLNYSGQYIVDMYKKRFLIEEMFRDYKHTMGFGKYSNAQNEKRLFGLLALYSLEYIVVYEMEKGIVKDKRYSFYVHFRNRVISTLAKGILNENLKSIAVLVKRRFK